MKNNPQSQSRAPSPIKRPLSVTILIAVVLIITSLNVLQLIAAAYSWDFLISLPLDVSVIYLEISGAIWSGVGLVLVYGFFTRRKWSLRMAQVAALTYSAYYWMDKLFIAKRFVIENRWQFAVVLNLMLVIVTFWTLQQPKTRAFANR